MANEKQYTLNAVELQELLERNNWNKSAAAKELGCSRPIIDKLIRQNEIQKPASEAMKLKQIYMPVSLVKRLQKLADQEKLSFSEYVRKTLEAKTEKIKDA